MYVVGEGEREGNGEGERDWNGEGGGILRRVDGVIGMYIHRDIPVNTKHL